MLDVVLPTILLALLFLFLRHLPSYLSLPSTRRSTLPTPYRLSPRIAGWVVERHGLTLSVTTSSLNALPRKILARFTPTQRGRSLLGRFYDAGVVVGGVGSLAGIAGAVWAWASVWYAVWQEAEAHARVQAASNGQDGEVVTVLARTLSSVARAVAPKGLPEVHAANPGLQPLIPGITTPLSHLPTLVLALILAQLIHELGHALSAALDDISPSRLAFSIHLVVPSASVMFPSSVDYLPSRSRARLATSGPWHNCLLWIALAAAVRVSGGWMWVDRGSQGRVVMDIALGSSLGAHISRGDIITHVDDVFVGMRSSEGKSEDIDRWTSYLQSDDNDDDGRGWCIDEQEFKLAPVSPCTEAHLIAFASTPLSFSSDAHCLVPHTIMSSPITPCRCSSNQICIRTALSEHVLRIRYKSGRRTHTILWSGDRRAVLDQLEVGTMAPRFLGSTVRWGTSFMNYFQMVSLSLFIFNLIPLPHTDGIQLFSALLSTAPSRHPRHARQLTSTSTVTATSTANRHPTINPYRYESGSDDDDEDEDGERGERGNWGAAGGGGGRREEVWQRRLRRIVEGSTSALVAGWALGWAMLALLRSS